MPSFRHPRNGQTMTLRPDETGGIKTLLRLGWLQQGGAPLDPDTGREYRALDESADDETREMPVAVKAQGKK